MSEVDRGLPVPDIQPVRQALQPVETRLWMPSMKYYSEGRPYRSLMLRKSMKRVNDCLY
ncbi:MAG: hypothetical protein AB2565_15760 [Candidatus Thiodiazotropha endolucinida]|uniref:hypothetical protein n=1 Tax=Candidatus Thiodiazotropha endolucinida TaxID=1655433 RepID=UPI0012B67EC8|nr:hypothetical protein [Candidatus Thiodiazotropha endolucinida]MBT3011966.1 hypothetical protein [Candidatus Thiodiazotropha sp. (ex Lucina pensylvanica)]MBT3016943.1 hypothetical protein [Candidatus Thiodiazotropha taylori]MBT3052106.1 hypothetical protein [Candidatus Thiodiazotropha sp. (ex Codakia orbicularis)]MBV2119373.1 hypothetical protein [Candidatus Thiodiazotropha sp. (ex Lucina aurantia)]